MTLLTTNTNAALSVVSLKTILACDYKVEYIINPFLPKGESLLIVGKSDAVSPH